jgi:hypothetical protein
MLNCQNVKNTKWFECQRELELTLYQRTRLCWSMLVPKRIRDFLDFTAAEGVVSMMKNLNVVLELFILYAV